MFPSPQSILPNNEVIVTFLYIQQSAIELLTIETNRFPPKKQPAEQQAYQRIYL